MWKLYVLDKGYWKLYNVYTCKDYAISFKATLVNTEQYRTSEVMICEG